MNAAREEALQYASQGFDPRNPLAVSEVDNNLVTQSDLEDLNEEFKLALHPTDPHIAMSHTCLVEYRKPGAIQSDWFQTGTYGTESNLHAKLREVIRESRVANDRAMGVRTERIAELKQQRTAEILEYRSAMASRAKSEAGKDAKKDDIEAQIDLYVEEEYEFSLNYQLEEAEEKLAESKAKGGVYAYRHWVWGYFKNKEMMDNGKGIILMKDRGEIRVFKSREAIDALNAKMKPEKTRQFLATGVEPVNHFWVTVR